MLRLHKSGLPLRATLLIVVAAVLSGCGRGGGPILHSASDPVLTVSPSKIDFWGVRVGSKSSKSVTLTNSGTGTLTISQTTLMGSPFSLSGLSLPLNLSAGQSLRFSVVFAPAAGGPASGSLSVTSNASTPPPLVGLSGMGAIYQLTAATSSLNFGNVALTSTSTKTASFTNTGTVTLTISQIIAAPAGFSLKGPNLPATLEPGQSTGVSVTFAPAATGAASGSLVVVSAASASPATVALEGTGVTYQLGVSPGSLNFGTITVASTTTQTLTLSNTGTASLIISQASVTGTGFSLSGLSLPLTLVPGQSAPVIVTFAPSAASTAAGSVSIISSASALPVTIAVSGLGATYQLTPSFSSLSFANVAVAMNSAQTISLTNTGTGNVTISQITLSGTGFSLKGVSTPVTLIPGQSVTLHVTFAPSVVGSAAGTISVISNASGPPMVVSLAGTGATYQLTLSSNSLSFGNVAVASSSAQTVTLTNTGTASLTITQISVAGTGFSLKSPALPITLAAGQSTSFTVTFLPSGTGFASGTISVVSDASTPVMVLSLSGTGATYQLTPSSTTVSFGDVTLGQSAILPVSLTSIGTASVTISQVTVTGPGLTVSSPSLPLILAPGQSTSVSITFAPTAGGAFTGTLTVESSAAGSPLSEALSGTGVHCVDLTWTASSSQGVTGYNVYRSGASGGPYVLITASPVMGTSFTDSAVTAGQMYYYQTAAIGDGGVESGPSNVASTTVPAP